MLFACISFVFAFQVVCCVSPRAEEKQAYKLVFSLSEGTLLHYKSFNQTEQSFGGMDVSMNQTSEVDMAFGGAADSTGDSRVDLKYIKVNTGLVAEGKLQEWEPPIKLEGATIKVTVSPAGDVVRFDPGRHIEGLQNPEDLRDVVNAWFVRLPDSAVTVGQSWTEPIVEGQREGAEPDAKGEAVYTLKKVEKKGNLEVAVIEGKINLKLNQDTPVGVLIGEGKADVKAQVAIEGGYIVELKETMEIRGDIVSKDPITDKETRRQTTVTRYFERKLQR
jgi:hypothetical protein